MSELIMYIVFAYVVFKILTGPIGKKLFVFTRIARSQYQAKGARDTAHAVIDGLFEGASKARTAAASGAGRVRGTVTSTVAAHTPKDWSYDAESNELTLFIGRSQDLVFHQTRHGSEALLVDMGGKETRMNPKTLERYLRAAERRNQLSRGQEMAIRDYMRRNRN